MSVKPPGLQVVMGDKRDKTMSSKMKVGFPAPICDKDRIHKLKLKQFKIRRLFSFAAQCIFTVEYSASQYGIGDAHYK
jgi:hypothetical protein